MSDCTLSLNHQTEKKIIKFFETFFETRPVHQYHVVDVGYFYCCVDGGMMGWEKDCTGSFWVVVF